MIEVEFEEKSPLSSQDRYDIISFSMEAADDNGFLNSFVFERGLLVYAAIVLYPEDKDKWASLAAENLIGAWDMMVADGILDKMSGEYAPILDTLTEEAAVWYEEYSAYAHSARGILDIVQTFSSDIMQTAANRLQTTAQQTGVTQLLETAEEWGMTRDALADHPDKENIQEEESLFQEEE